MQRMVFLPSVKKIVTFSFASSKAASNASLKDLSYGGNQRRQNIFRIPRVMVAGPVEPNTWALQIIKAALLAARLDQGIFNGSFFVSCRSTLQKPSC